MSRESVVFLLGIFLTVLPFLGVPGTWKQYLIAGVGAILILVGYSLRRSLYLSKIDKGNGERGDNSFVETTKPLFGEDIVQ